MHVSEMLEQMHACMQVKLARFISPDGVHSDDHS
jgi:hypothetical protein